MSNQDDTSGNLHGELFDNKVQDFSSPTMLPDNEEQAKRWQEANKQWWESTPMRYDWKDKIDCGIGSPEFFQEIDKRFFNAVSHYMPWDFIPFDNLLDYSTISNKEVLEIGVGHGSHAQLIAPNCKKFTGIDLTDHAVNMTKQRMSHQNLQAQILTMDAEHLDFEDNSFDLVWSWGVIHHSANTTRILSEIARVLRPGGRAILMVYHRSFWKYYIMDGLVRGIILGHYFKKKSSLHRVNQSQTDGAIARYYTINEWLDICCKQFKVQKITITGQKLDLIPLPPGNLKETIVRLFPDIVTRFFTNRLKMGSFLISELTKPTI